ncbi:MAG: amino acid transporter rane protein family [Bacillales bacterium]|jgi:putative lysine transport system permease protein|nr:amino acid transporter rane protein family [Bacillales bacterium]
MEKTFYDWVVYIIENYGVWFLKGAGVTLLIALTGTIIGSIFGLLIGIIKTIPLSNHVGRFSPKRIGLKLVNILLTIYIEVFRGTPMIVQAIVIYYGIAEAWGINWDPIVAGIFIVSINTGAYMSEVVRGGIQSVDKGQTEAAHAIGMTHWQTMLHVVLPQTIRNILPATGNEFVINIKDTAVLNVITVTELFFMTKSVSGAIYKTYEPFLVAASIYLFLTLVITRILRYVEKRMDGPSSYTIFGSSTMPEQILKRGEQIV